MQIAAPASPAVASGTAPAPLAALSGTEAGTFAAAFETAENGVSVADASGQAQAAFAMPAITPVLVGASPATASSAGVELPEPVAPAQTGNDLPGAGKGLPLPLRTAALVTALSAASGRTDDGLVPVRSPDAGADDEDANDPRDASASLIAPLPQPAFGVVAPLRVEPAPAPSPVAPPAQASARGTPSATGRDLAEPSNPATTEASRPIAWPTGLKAASVTVPAVVLVAEPAAPAPQPAAPAPEVRIATPIAAGLARGVASEGPEASSKTARPVARTAALRSLPALATSITPEPVPFQPAVAAAQPTASQASPAGAVPSAAAEPARPMDIATLVDAIARARDEVAPRVVAVSLAHAEFGRVSLRFRQGEDSLDVAMTSADPGFARAVSAAPHPVAAPREGAAATDAGRGQDSAQASFQQGGGQGQAAGQNTGSFRGASAGAANRSRQPGAEAEVDNSDIFA